LKSDWTAGVSMLFLLNKNKLLFKCRLTVTFHNSSFLHNAKQAVCHVLVNIQPTSLMLQQKCQCANLGYLCFTSLVCVANE